MGLLCLGTLGCGTGSSSSQVETTGGDEVENIEAQLQFAVQSGDWARAESLGRKAILANPEDPDVLTHAAVAKSKMGDRVTAANLLMDAVHASGFDTSGPRVDHAIAALLDVGRIFEALELIEQVLMENPSDHRYRRMLVGFLGELQLPKELDEHMSVLIRERQFDLPLLLATTETNERRFSSRTLDELRKRNPEDHRPRLGVAQARLSRRDAPEAEKILRDIIEHHPRYAPAHAMLGRVLVQQGKIDALQTWEVELPDGATDYAGYWVALAAITKSAGQPAETVRALGEGTRRAPNDISLWLKLNEAVHAWKASGDKCDNLDAVLSSIDARIQHLIALREHVSDLTRENQRTKGVGCAIAKELLDLGRNWEAAAWLAIVDRLSGEPPSDLPRLRQRVARSLAKSKDWQSLSGHAELKFDLGQFPLPQVDGLKSVWSNSQLANSSHAFLPIRMNEEAVQRGLDFYASVGPGIRGPLVPIAETLGCGGGTIDYDLDGKHDLVFTAAGGSIRLRDSHPGAVFRNLGGTFADVSFSANCGDEGFGHGVAVGDYNDDGFDDVLLLNLGQNSLFKNNGDGTFQDVSDLLPQRREHEWSTSAAILDLDGDGFNDIVITNYCEARQPIEKRC